MAYFCQVIYSIAGAHKGGICPTKVYLTTPCADVVLSTAGKPKMSEA
jgi:hypothetical protein